MALNDGKRWVQEKNALLIGIQTNPRTKVRALTRYWDRISDRQAQDSLLYLDTYTSTKNAAASFYVTNPTASTEPVAGVWTAIANRMAKEGEAPGIYQELSEVRPVANIAALAALTPVLVQAHEVTFPFSIMETDDVETEYIAYMYHGIQPSSRAAVVALTAASLVSSISGAGWTYADRKWDELNAQPANTATFSVLFKKVTHKAWVTGEDGEEANSVNNPVHEKLVSPGTHWEQRRREWPRIAVADQAALDAIVSELAALGDSYHATDPLTIEDWAVASVEHSDNNDGSYNFSQTLIKASDETDIAYKSLDSDGLTATERECWGQSAMPTAAAVTGKRQRVTGGRNHQTGKFDYNVDTETAVALDTGWTSYTDRFGTSYARGFRNQISALTSGFTDATTNSLSVQKNQFGRYDGSASRRAVRPTNYQTDAVIVSERTQNVRQLETRRYHEANYYRFVNYKIKTNAEQTRAGAQNEEDEYGAETPRPLKTGIRKFSDATGKIWYEAWAMFFNGADAWAEEPVGGISA